MSATDMPFEGHEALVAELRAAKLAAPEHLHRRVLALRSERSPRRLSIPRGRRLVVLVPVAAALAVGAAFIHGAFDSGNRTPMAAPLAANAVVHGEAAKPAIVEHTAHRSAEKKLTTGSSFTKPTTRNSPQAYREPAAPGAAFQSSLSSAGTQNLDELAGPALGKSPGAYSPVNIPRNRLVHADVAMAVAVRDHAALTRATNKASQIVAQLGGYAQSVQYQASRKGYGNAFLDLRVPVGKTETAIGRLNALGKLLSQQVGTEDLQQTYTKQTNTIGSLKRAIAIYEQALSSGSVSGSQRVEVQIRLANAEHKLTSERKARGHTVTSAATADIQLTLTTNQHAFVGGGSHHKTGRLGRLLHNAGDFLALEGVIVLYALIVVSPFAVLFALWWFGVRERRRRDERRLLASA